MFPLCFPLFLQLKMSEILPHFVALLLFVPSVLQTQDSLKPFRIVFKGSVVLLFPPGSHGPGTRVHRRKRS